MSIEKAPLIIAVWTVSTITKVKQQAFGKNQHHGLQHLSLMTFSMLINGSGMIYCGLKSTKSLRKRTNLSMRLIVTYKCNHWEQ